MECPKYEPMDGEQACIHMEYCDPNTCRFINTGHKEE